MFKFHTFYSEILGLRITHYQAFQKFIGILGKFWSIGTLWKPD